MPDESTIAGRLGSLIGNDDRHTMTIRTFAQKMKDHKPRPPGSTRAMVHRYLKEDGPEPPPKFLAVAAEKLNVNALWLAFDIGPRTPGDGFEEGVSRAAMGPDWTDDLGGALLAAVGTEVPWVTRAVVAHHWRKLYRRASYNPATRREPMEMLRRLMEAVTAPLKSLESEPRIEDLATYIMAVVPAIALVEERRIAREQVTVRDVKGDSDA